MGLLCSRPRTVEDKLSDEPVTEGVIVSAESGHKQQTSVTPQSYDLHSDVVQRAVPEAHDSDVELSELDMVVEQLRNNQNTVTGSAPELLQQWDHDHRVVLDSIDASIQKAQRQHHREGSSSLAAPVSHHIPAAYLHTASPLSNSKLGSALQSSPPPAQHLTHQAVPLDQEPLLLQAKQAYADGRLLQSHKRLQELSDLRGIDYLHSEVLPPDIGPELAGLPDLKLKIDEGLRELKNHEGWSVSRNDDLQVMYRHHPGTSVHSFKFAADFNSPLEHILAMSREFDLTHSWNRYVTESVILSEPSIFESTLYAASWLPFPFPHIDVVVSARGIDLADEERCLLIMVNTPEDMSKWSSRLPTSSAKCKRADILPGSCIRLEPLAPSPSGQGRVRASVVVHMDPHIKHVPAGLITFVLKIMSPFLFSTIQKVLKSEFDSPSKVLPTRMREKPELYGLIRPRIEEYIHHLQEG
ncbi:hypothetical protein ABBQ32_006825 [Trebouxia sp. C0010 RCD-2024]